MRLKFTPCFASYAACPGAGLQPLGKETLSSFAEVAPWPKRGPQLQRQTNQTKTPVPMELISHCGDTDTTKINHIVCETVTSVKEKIKQERGNRKRAQVCHFRVLGEGLTEKMTFLFRTLSNQFSSSSLFTCLTLGLELLLVLLTLSQFFYGQLFIFQSQSKCHLLKGAFPGYFKVKELPSTVSLGIS